ncbi:VanZ family protein [Paenibacillus campi]|uniref:VanZ family protein n=1 Tax=Paenibacillus campi TaxID=3106031 RepID=UPI002AFF6D21|nr:VanZ family protein [Paenibacillus sp. SGZ-1009]
MSTMRKTILILFIVYTILILYFMFVGFERMGDVAQSSEYTFMWIPDSFYKLPDVAELLSPSIMKLVSFGNTFAFIPFGLFIPLLYRISFFRFIGLFMLCIITLETVQAFTKLGSFDINDVIQNSWGAAIGYGAYKLGTRGTTVLQKTGIAIIGAALLIAGTIVLNKGIDELFTQRQGVFTALNEWTDRDGKPGQQASLSSFTIDGKEISPQFNVYNAKDGKATTYTYDLGGKDVYLFVNYGVPDPDSGAAQGKITLSVDGQETLSDCATYQQGEPLKFYWFFEQGKELTITLEGEEKVWDLGYREMKYLWE